MATDHLKELDKAFKSITTDVLGKSIIAPEQQNRFIQVASESQPLLDSSRRIVMNSHTRNIDRISMTGQMLHTVGETDAAPDAEDPTFHTNELIAREVAGKFRLYDQTLEDNLERGTLEQTLVSMAGAQAGRDLANLFVNGDVDSGSTKTNRTDGWLKKAANILDGTDFDPAAVEDLFGTLITVLDKRYLTNPADWTIWTDWATADAYRDGLRNRNTGLGDSAQTEFAGLRFKGFEVAYDPNIPSGSALLSMDDNRVWGVYRDIRIEPQRSAIDRATDFVVSARVDCHYEDENAAIVASGYTGEPADSGDEAGA